MLEDVKVDDVDGKSQMANRMDTNMIYMPNMFANDQ